MNENLIELINKINGSPEYQKNLAQCKSKEELFEYCSSIHNGYTPEELNHFILGIASINKLGVANINELKNKTDVIENNELSKIHGGVKKDAQTVEIGTVNQINKKIKSWDECLGACAGTVDILNELYKRNIEDMSSQEIMEMATSLLNDWGFH